jgi:septal ring factor EnvC (AmiA/AmiB activator)
LQRLAALPGRWIVDREIILRSDRSTRCLRISRRVQLIALGLWAVTTGWMSFASTSYFEISRVLDTRTAALDQAHDAYRDLLNQMANHQLAVMAITRDLESKQGHLRALLNQNENLRQDLKLTETQLRQSEAERTKVAQTRQAVAEKMSELEQTVRSMWGENGSLERHISGLRGQLASIEAEKEEIAAQRSALSRRMSQLQTELKTSLARTAQVEAQLETARSDLHVVTAQRDRLQEDGQLAQVRVRDLEGRIGELQRVHREVMQKLNDRTRADLGEVQKIANRTGLNLDTLLPREAPPARPSARSGGQGGPLVPLFRDLMPSSRCPTRSEPSSAGSTRSTACCARSRCSRRSTPSR